MCQSSALESLRDFIRQVPLVDTHEHLDSEESWLSQKADISHLFRHYASCDLVSAGMPPADLAQVRSEQVDSETKWELLEPYWIKARNTTYCRALDIAIRDLYGLPGLSRETYGSVMKKMDESRRPGWYREVLKDKANIEISVIVKWDPGLDPDFFVQSINLDEFATVSNRPSANALAERTGKSIYSLQDLVSALDVTFEKLVADGAVAIKCGLAYSRPIFFENATQHEAEQVFNRAFRRRGEGASWDECKPLQDFMIHQIVRRAEAHGLAMQFHTGIQEGNGNYVADTNPTRLTNLFMMYRNARFDIFHAGFPYSRELGVIAKNFPNVYPDMCWMHVIGAAPARNILDEWLDLIPANKILAFGGDYRMVEGVYGHSVIARENVARVLADRVERGDQTLDEAHEIAERILRLNARELFRLDR
ncbi:MAG: amidohydrolase family protein [Armatimonadota bacterium]|nr:amidohydrolase family protein [Armatimonadota bacterium]